MKHCWENDRADLGLREALGRRVIRVKYGSENRGWCSNSILGSYGMSLWKTIGTGWSTAIYFLHIWVTPFYDFE